MKIIKPETARQGESRPADPEPGVAEATSGEPAKQRQQKPKKKTAAKKDGVTARDRAKTIAQDEYDIELGERRPMTAAERRAKRRREYVAVSFEFPPETAAKLFALAERSGSSQTGVVRQLIDDADLPDE